MKLNKSKLLRYLAELFFLSVIAAPMFGVAVGSLFFGILGIPIFLLIIYAYINIAYFLDKKIKDDIFYAEGSSFTEKFNSTFHLTIPAVFFGYILITLIDRF